MLTFARCRAAGERDSYKFLDEFGGWRELSYTWCHDAVHEDRTLATVAVLPDWARQTLLEHAADRRDVKSLAQLERGTTQKPGWDAMQYQLRTTGELHNNLRMGWGKAFIGWTATVEEGMRHALHCNDKYALDGCDPCSVGGVLWCFGLFDSPKGRPNTPIYGKVATRVLYKVTTQGSAYRNLPV